MEHFRRLLRPVRWQEATRNLTSDETDKLKSLLAKVERTERSATPRGTAALDVPEPDESHDDTEEDSSDDDTEEETERPLQRRDSVASAASSCLPAPSGSSPVARTLHREASQASTVCSKAQLPNPPGSAASSVLVLPDPASESEEPANPEIRKRLRNKTGPSAAKRPRDLVGAAEEAAKDPLPGAKDALGAIGRAKKKEIDPDRATELLSPTLGRIRIMVAKAQSYITMYNSETNKWPLVVSITDSMLKDHPDSSVTHGALIWRIFKKLGDSDMDKAGAVNYRNKLLEEAGCTVFVPKRESVWEGVDPERFQDVASKGRMLKKKWLLGDLRIWS